MPDRPLVFYVKCHVKPECVDAWLQAVDEIVEHMSKEEAFVACYLHRDTRDPNLFTLYERWNEPSVEAFLEHQAKPYRQAYEARLPALLQRPREADVLAPMSEWHGAARQAVPIFRMFDERKARQFYVDFLGFRVDWEHRFEDGAPLYLQVSREGCRLHLSEHHGDCCPGSAVRVPTGNLDDYCRELNAKRYAFARPGIETQPWGKDMTITDPFGNRLTFTEPAGGA